MKTISWVSSGGRVRVLPHRNFSLAVSLHLLPITTNVHSPSVQKWCKIVPVFTGLFSEAALNRYSPTDFFFFSQSYPLTLLISKHKDTFQISYQFNL